MISTTVTTVAIMVAITMADATDVAATRLDYLLWVLVGFVLCGGVRPEVPTLRVREKSVSKEHD